MNMDKRTWAIIDLDKLRQNVRALQQELNSKGEWSAPLASVTRTIKILAVVKADAYGHGAKEISISLKEAGVEMLGVATVDEAYELKEIGLPIVILFPVPVDNIPTIVSEGFIPTIIDYGFAKELEREAKHQNKKIKVHIEIDTGIMTAGAAWEEGVEFVVKLQGLKNLELDGIFTHFAESEDRDSGFTDLQIERFKGILNELDKMRIRIPLVHAASTAGILNFPNSYFNMVRPGIMLYGLYASPKCNKRVRVEPILSWHTKVGRVTCVPKGTGISYHRTYITNREQKIATLLVGYGDGYPRDLSNKGTVIIKGRLAKIVGTVCMDLTMVDVTDIPGVEVGDEVTLIGKDGENEITADEVASLAGSISYEITTRICPRVVRIYTQNGQPCRTRHLLGSGAHRHWRGL